MRMRGLQMALARLAPLIVLVVAGVVGGAPARAQEPSVDGEVIPPPPSEATLPPADDGSTAVAVARLAGQPTARRQLGSSLALDAPARTLVVGASRGQVQLFHRSEEGWRVGHSWRAPRRDRRGAVLGVAIDGTGTTAAAALASRRRGVAVLDLARSGIRERQWLEPEGRQEPDGFGASVAMSGDGAWIVVGAPQRRVDGTAVGAVFVFRRLAERWTAVQTLRAPGPSAGSAFGAAVAIAADASLVVVGAPGTHAARGGVHVFVRENDQLVPVQTLADPEGEPGDTLGQSLALSPDGSVLVAGAPRDDLGDVQDVGAVHVFHHPSGQPFRRLLVRRSSESEIDRGARGLGHAVALGRHRIVASRRGASPLVVSMSTTAEPVGLEQVRPNDSTYGVSVAISGDGRFVLVGAPRDDPRGVSLAGSVHVHEITTHEEALRRLAARQSESAQAAQTVRRAADRERRARDRALTQALLGATLVAVTTAAELGFRLVLASPSSCSGFLCVDATKVLAAVGLFTVPLGMSALAIGALGGVGSAMGGRALRVHGFLGYLVGGALGAAVVGGAMAYIGQDTMTFDEENGLLGGAIAVAGALGVTGYIVASTLSDHSAQAGHDEPELVPLVSLGVEQAIVGASGAF